MFFGEQMEDPLPQFSKDLFTEREVSWTRQLIRSMTTKDGLISAVKSIAKELISFSVRGGGREAIRLSFDAWNQPLERYLMIHYPEALYKDVSEPWEHIATMEHAMSFVRIVRSFMLRPIKKYMYTYVDAVPTDVTEMAPAGLKQSLSGFFADGPRAALNRLSTGVRLGLHPRAVHAAKWSLATVPLWLSIDSLIHSLLGGVAVSTMAALTAATSGAFVSVAEFIALTWYYIKLAQVAGMPVRAILHKQKMETRAQRRYEERAAKHGRWMAARDAGEVLDLGDEEGQWV